MPEGRLEAKSLYRRLDSLLGGLDPRRPPGAVLEGFLEGSFRAFRDDLHLRAALLYREGRDAWELVRAAGETVVPRAEVLEPSAPTLERVFRHGVYVFRRDGEPAAPHLHGILPEGEAAAFVVGSRPRRHVFVYLLADGWVMEELDFALNTARAALGSRLMEERVRGSFREAAEIQQSLLLEEPPDFTGFELACRSLATDEVSGDFYDFHPFGPEMLGLSIGDASGHGLPAALLVRDVVTGLRMGLEKDLKVAYVFSKLNRVIHRSNLSSRFVSVFYGELEADGSFVYVNAGHQPPLLFTRGGVRELATGGTVIGPLPEASFRRGFARLEAGDVLVLCTDGILERRGGKGEFFGVEGLRAVAEKHRRAPAEEILERVFEATLRHGDGRPWEDDATLVVVRRQETQRS